jgi:molybdate transport system ATP-binding protein
LIHARQIVLTTSQTDNSPQFDDSAPAVISLIHANIWRTDGEAVFRDLNWTICEGETWAIVGPVGSGKTTLIDALAGRLRSEGITWPFVERLERAGRRIEWPSQVIERVSFKEESRLFSYARHYYQQRFNFIEPDDDLTLDAFLHSRTSASEDERRIVCERLGVENLRGLSLIKLSNGQTRRARIARALLSRPEILLLDEPFMGLDGAGRAEVDSILGNLVRQKQRVVLITRPETIPDWATHVLEMGRLAIRTLMVSGEWRTANRKVESETPQTVPASSVVDAGNAPVIGEPIIEMRNVGVVYDGRFILRDVNWTVRRGERWAVLGPNGSGKSTLLSLIAADHPQAYSNDVFLFGRKRGGGETIWEIKRDIGLVSPEIHLYFSEPLTAFRAAATGFFDVLAHRPTTPAQDAIIYEFFEFFGVWNLAHRRFTQLSTGEQRLILLIRALVKSPPVLILDEPFQGLDAGYVKLLRNWLDERLRPDQTLIFVSHVLEEIPRTVNRLLRLQNGEVEEMIENTKK